MGEAPHAFVTGATGFIGGHLVDALSAAGWRITATHRAGSDVGHLAARGVSLIEAPLLDPHATHAAIPEEVDAVFHLAASTSQWRLREAAQIRSNVEVTRNVVAAALDAGAKRFVHCSSEAVFGVASGVILTERSPKRGRLGPTPYHRTKYIAERTVLDARARGLRPVVVSPAHVLGPRDHGGWVRMIRMIDQGTLPGIPPGAGSFCDARDVAAAMVAAAERGRVGECYLLGGHDVTFEELIALVARELSRPVPRRRVRASVLEAMAHLAELASYVTGREPDLTPSSATLVTHRIFVSSEKAERELDYRVRPLAETLHDTIRWLHTEGLLRPR